MTTITSRRAILAGAATLPALAVPTAVAASAEPDPIFAAIERSRRAEADFGAAEGDNALDHFGEIAYREFVALIAMTPATPAGCAALLRYIEKRQEEEYSSTALFANSCQDTPIRKHGRTLLSRIAGALEAKA
jgi:hypothetical protein